jgi:hypothetical protein
MSGRKRVFDGRLFGDLLMEGFDYRSLVADPSQSMQQGLATGMALGQFGQQQAALDQAQEARQAMGGLVAQSQGVSAEALMQKPEFKRAAELDPQGTLQLVNAISTRDKNSFDVLEKRNKQQSLVVGSLAVIKDDAAQKNEIIKMAQQHALSSDPFLQEKSAALIDLANMPFAARQAKLQQALIMSDSGDAVYNSVTGGGEGGAAPIGAGFLTTDGGKQYHVVPLRGGGIQKTEITGQLTNRTGLTPDQQISIDITGAGGKAEAAESGKAEGELVKTNDLVLQDAPQRLAKVRRLRAIATDLDAGGWSDAVKNSISKVIPGFAGATIEEARSALTNEAIAALQGFKGPTTDFEFGKATEAGATIGNTRDGNLRIIDSLEKGIIRDISLSKDRKAFKKQGGKMADFDTSTWMMEKGYVPTDYADLIGGGQPTQQPTNTQQSGDTTGWTLMTDANGNKAYVSPDGSQFKEAN